MLRLSLKATTRTETNGHPLRQLYLVPTCVISSRWQYLSHMSSSFETFQAAAAATPS